MDMAVAIRDRFREVYGAEPERCAFAPGRVNLIGEHTDYNGGHVFPCALKLGTYCAAKKRGDGRLRFYSANYPGETAERELDGLAPQKGGGWTRYPEGVIWEFMRRGLAPDCGADFVFWGNIPAGAGLSSSASIEVAAALILCALYGFALSAQEIAVIGQRAENDYVGVSCGIMDQFASAMGSEHRAIYLDTATLEYEYAPCDFGCARLIICNSKVKHAHAGSGYNDRRRECEAALEALRRVRPISALCELTPEEFEACKDAVSNPKQRMRARHAIYENRRAVLALEALKDGRTADFGALMNESHYSMRDDFEASCAEIDLLVDMAQSLPFVLGSRITGGGFGGCTISLVDNSARGEFMQRLSEGYRRETGIEPEFYAADVGGGAHII